MVSVAAWLVGRSVGEVWCESWGVAELNWWTSVSSWSGACGSWNPWLVVSQWLARLVCVLRSHCWLDDWLHCGLHHWSCIVQQWNWSLTRVWSNVNSVGFKDILWNSSSASDETQSVRERSWWVNCTHELSINVGSWSNCWQEVWNDGSFVKFGILNVMAWIIHTKVFVNPNFGFTVLCESNHFVCDSTWDNHFWNVVQTSDSVVKNDQWLLFVESWNSIEQKWDSLSKDKSAFLSSTESETSRGKVGSNDLNPIGSSSSLVINIDFIIEVSVGLDIEVVKVSLLSFFASHHFVESGSFNLFPFLWIVVELFCLWVMVSHFGDFFIGFYLLRFIFSIWFLFNFLTDYLNYRLICINSSWNLNQKRKIDSWPFWVHCARPNLITIEKN